jgi:coiled-coil domain-containing protein 55
MSLSTVGKVAKYGLITRKKENPSRKLNTTFYQARMTFSNFIEAKKPSVFGADKDDDEDHDGNEGLQIKKANKEIFKTQKYEKNDELDEVYDYDGQYDVFKQEREQILFANQKASQPTQVSSRYIDSLKASAKVREKEKERLFEKKLLKERSVEDKEHEDKEKFITSAYKAKLQEEKNWEYEDRIAEEIEKRQDVKKQGMQNFYANLFTKNISMGGDLGSAISAYTAGSDRQKHMDNAEAKQATESDMDQRHGSETETNLGNETERKAELPPSSSSSTERKDAPWISKQTDSNEAEKEQQSTTKSSQLPVVLSKEEQIAAAKQRYLSRKRPISQVNETN